MPYKVRGVADCCANYKKRRRQTVSEGEKNGYESVCMVHRLWAGPVAARSNKSKISLSARPIGGWRTESAVVVRPRLRGCGRGCSEVSCAESEGRRGRVVGVYGSGHVFPIVSNLR